MTTYGTRNIFALNSVLERFITQVVSAAGSMEAFNLLGETFPLGIVWLSQSLHGN